MNEKLQHDWEHHPCLRYYAFESLEKLEKFVKEIHRKLQMDEALIYGYLYQKQVAENKRLKERVKELENVSK